MTYFTSNKIQCKACNDIVESEPCTVRQVHPLTEDMEWYAGSDGEVLVTDPNPFKFCSCGAVAVKGGLTMIDRLGGEANYIELATCNYEMALNNVRNNAETHFQDTNTAEEWLDTELNCLNGSTSRDACREGFHAIIDDLLLRLKLVFNEVESARIIK